MKIVLQRVKKAMVKVDNEIVADTQKGLLLLVGVTHTDTQKEIDFLVNKCLNLRIFEDDNGKMNLSVLDIKGEITIVSQFTLYGNTAKGRRPGFDMAAKPEKAKQLFDIFLKQFKEVSGLKVESGIFGADMEVSLVNDGPATFILEL